MSETCNRPVPGPLTVTICPETVPSVGGSLETDKIGKRGRDSTCRRRRRKVIDVDISFSYYPHRSSVTPDRCTVCDKVFYVLLIEDLGGLVEHSGNVYNNNGKMSTLFTPSPPFSERVPVC